MSDSVSNLSFTQLTLLRGMYPTLKRLEHIPEVEQRRLPSKLLFQRLFKLSSLQLFVIGHLFNGNSEHQSEQYYYRKIEPLLRSELPERIGLKWDACDELRSYFDRVRGDDKGYLICYPGRPEPGSGPLTARQRKWLSVLELCWQDVAWFASQNNVEILREIGDAFHNIPCQVWMKFSDYESIWIDCVVGFESRYGARRRAKRTYQEVFDRLG